MAHLDPPFLCPPFLYVHYTIFQILVFSSILETHIISLAIFETILKAVESYIAMSTFIILVYVHTFYFFLGFTECLSALSFQNTIYILHSFFPSPYIFAYHCMYTHSLPWVLIQELWSPVIVLIYTSQLLFTLMFYYLELLGTTSCFTASKNFIHNDVYLQISIRSSALVTFITGLFHSTNEVIFNNSHHRCYATGAAPDRSLSLYALHKVIVVR